MCRWRQRNPASFNAGERWPHGTLFVRALAGLGWWFETFLRTGTWVPGLRSRGCSIVVMKNNVKE
jgi:hypothetical protein